jgi:Flp pilus assembly protein TadG
MRHRLTAFADALARDTGGLALLEFAFVFPVLLLLCVGGGELANYTITKMRISQIALQTADNAARMGTGSPLAAKVISETDINDVFAGAQIDSGKLDLNANGRIILSSLEPMANPNTNDRYKIVWQRCYGTKTAHASSYGVAGATDKPYMGPDNKPTKALDDNATMFVEVYYVYKPLISFSNPSWQPSTQMVEVASMTVRDRRNLTSAPDNTAGSTLSSC